MRTALTYFLILGYVMSSAQSPSGFAGADATVSTVALPGISAKAISIKVMDMRTREEIPFFTIDFTSCGHPMYESSEAGVFSLKAEKGFACHTRISKSGYAHVDLLLDYEEIRGEEKTFNVFLSRSPNYYQGILRDKLERSLYLDNASVEISALEDGSVQRSVTDKHGQFALYLLPQRTYDLAINRRSYKPFKTTFSTGEKVDPSVIRQLFMEPKDGQKRIGLGTEVGVQKKDRFTAGEAISYYSIQVAAKRSDDIDLDQYELALSKYGEVFTDDRYKLVKIKVGKYFDKSVAEQMLKMVRSNKGYEDAFLTKYIPVDGLPSQEESVDQVLYKVRLASYLNASLFNSSKIAHLGAVSELKKEDWTIFLLGDYVDLEVARTACEAARDLGFLSAHIVTQEGNTLKRIQ